jgi:hypothetical protein
MAMTDAVGCDLRINMEEDRRVDLDDPAIPAGIRAAVQPYWQPGDSLWRCPRNSGRTTWFSSKKIVVIEWWLCDANGELIETFWDDATQQR